MGKPVRRPRCRSCVCIKNTVDSVVKQNSNAEAAAGKLYIDFLHTNRIMNDMYKMS